MAMKPLKIIKSLVSLALFAAILIAAWWGYNKHIKTPERDRDRTAAVEADMGEGEWQAALDKLDAIESEPDLKDFVKEKRFECHVRLAHELMTKRVVESEQKWHEAKRRARHLEERRDDVAAGKMDEYKARLAEYRDRAKTYKERCHKHARTCLEHLDAAETYGTLSPRDMRIRSNAYMTLGDTNAAKEWMKKAASQD